MFFHWQAPGATPTTVTTSGTPTFDSTIKKFGTHSLRLDSSSSSVYDYVTYVTNQSYSSYPWTVEFFLYVSTNAYPGSQSQWVYGSNGVGIGIVPQSSTQYAVDFQPYAGTGTSFYPVEGNWYHIAWTKDSSGRYRNYVDGTLMNTTSTIPSGVNPTNAFSLGNNNGDTDAFICYVDEMRISKVARYTGASLTPPSAEFSADSDTVFLAHFNNSYLSDV